MRSPKETLHLTKRQLQKHFYRYVRLVKKGTFIQICESRRRPDPIVMMVPHDWYIEAIDLEKSLITNVSEGLKSAGFPALDDQEKE